MISLFGSFFLYIIRISVKMGADDTVLRLKLESTEWDYGFWNNTSTIRIRNDKDGRDFLLDFDLVIAVGSFDCLWKDVKK